MPKLPMDYSKSIIYKIVCKNPEIKDCYVGSTTNYDKRKNCHKSNCNNTNRKGYNSNVYQFIRNNGNWENWDMVEIEKYNCNDKLELYKQERFWLEELNASLNSQIPNRSQKQYREDNKDKIKEKVKEYYEDNKEKIKEKDKQYREDNKDKIKENKKQHYQDNKDKINEKVKCNICNKQMNKSSLTRHNKRLHNKIKEKVKCDICNKIMRSDSLNRHKKNIHNI